MHAYEKSINSIFGEPIDDAEEGMMAKSQL